MSERKTFECPSCSALMEFSGSDAVFQTCETCFAPIIVPVELLDKKNGAVYGGFAGLYGDNSAVPDPVEKLRAAGQQSAHPRSSGEPEIDDFDILSLTSQKEFSDIGGTAAPSDQEQPQITSDRATADPDTLATVETLLANGRKIEAVKLYRDKFNVDLKGAVAAVEKIIDEKFPGLN